MQEQLPYQPLTFIKTGTIGGTSQQIGSSISYDFKHHHIVQPKRLPSPKLVLYLLFHSAPIYNWLITVPTLQTTLLNQYILSSQSNSLSLSVDSKSIINNLQEYSKRWEVAKLVFSSTVYINQVRQHGSYACSHISKTEQYTVQLSYDKSKSELFCPSIICKECGRTVNIESTLKELSPAFVSTFSVPLLKTKKAKYEAWVVYTKDKVFIRGANKIWYEVPLGDKTSRIVGANQVAYKEALLVGYSLEGKEEQGTLIKAPPIKEEILKGDKEKKVVTESKENNTKVKEKQDNETLQKSKQKQVNLKMAGKVKALKYDATKILLPSDIEQPNYVRQVQNYLSKPKQKDSYELDYDRGKLKKKKEKRQYIQPNFNEVFEEVKKKSGVDTQSKKIKKRERKEKQPQSEED